MWRLEDGDVETWDEEDRGHQALACYVLVCSVLVSVHLLEAYAAIPIQAHRPYPMHTRRRTGIEIEFDLQATNTCCS